MCGCNMMDDGIDMDVLRSLPGKMIKKIAYHSNVPMEAYNDALKQAIKAKAKSSSTNVRSFLTGIPGVEAEIIKIEKMKEGGNLYTPYPKKAQGPFGPKYIDSKTMLSTYAEQQDKKTKEQYRTDMLSPMMQGGGSILNDIGKEHLIIPRNQGTELNIPKYIQAYVQATTNMGKYQDGGALSGVMQSMGGIGGITKMATELSSAFKKPEEPIDPNEPPLKRFDNGGVSEAMNFYIQHYPGYKEGLKGKFQSGGVAKYQDGARVVLKGVNLTPEQTTIYNQLLKDNNNAVGVTNKREGEGKGGVEELQSDFVYGDNNLNFYDGKGNYLGSISYTPEQKQGSVTSVNMPKKDSEALVIEGNPYNRGKYSFGKGEKEYELNNKDAQILKNKILENKLTGTQARKIGDKIEILKPNTNEVLLTVNAGDVYYPGQDYSNKNNASLARSADRYNFNLTKGEGQLQKEKDWLTNNSYNQNLQQSIDKRNSSDAELKAKRAVEDQEWAAQTQVIKDRKAKEQYDAMIKRRDSGYTDQTITTNSTPVKKQLKPIRKLTPDDLASDKFETIEKGGQSYKIDPKTKEVFTTDGGKVTDKRFVENILEWYKPNMQVIDLPKKEYDLQSEAAERQDIEGTQQAYRETIQGAKIRERLKQQLTLTPQVDKVNEGVSGKVKNKIIDFFTRTDEEKEERKQRRLNRK